MCRDLDLAPLDPATDRFMICGNMRVLADLREWLDGRGCGRITASEDS
jgi:ferredoxin--NADP+ reductase